MVANFEALAHPYCETGLFCNAGASSPRSDGYESASKDTALKSRKEPVVGASGVLASTRMLQPFHLQVCSSGDSPVKLHPVDQRLSPPWESNDHCTTPLTCQAVGLFLTTKMPPSAACRIRQGRHQLIPS